MRLTALAVVLGRFVALAQSQPETVSGVFQVVVVEDLGKTAPPSEESLQYSLLTGKETPRLIFEDPQDAAKIAPGSIVEVTGYRSGKQFTVPARGAEQWPGPHIRTMSAAQAPKTLGQRKVAVLLVNFQNDQRQLVDAGTANALLFGGANGTSVYGTSYGSVSGFYQEASYDNLTIAGDVYGYIALPIQSVCSQFADYGPVTTVNEAGFSEIQNASAQAAQAAGIDLNGYDTILVLGPELDSCSTGEAAGSLGGPRLQYFEAQER